MSPCLRADCPRAFWIIRTDNEGIVFALAVGAADGVDRREIEHIKAHSRHIRKARLTVLEGAVTPGLRSARAREHLIPGTKARTLWIHEHSKLLVIGDGQSSVRVLGHQASQFLSQSQFDCCSASGRLSLTQGFRPRLQLLCIRSCSPPACVFKQLGAYEQIEGHLLARLDLLGEPLTPGVE